MRWQITTAAAALWACGSGTAPVSTPTDGETTGAPVPAWDGLDDPRARMAIVGDFGTADANARAVEEQVRLWDVDHVWTTGDNTYSSPSAEAYQIDVDGVWGDYIASGGLAGGNRFWPCPGNHDWSFSEGLDAYVEHFDLPGNERYYAIRLGEVELFCVSSDPAEPDGIDPRSVQASWLKDALAQSTASWKWVTTHHPIHSSGMHGDTSGLDWPYLRWGASGVWSGHDHHYERVVKNGGVFGITGIGGVSLRSVDEGGAGSVSAVAGHHGATLLQIDAASATFTTVDVSGLVLDQFTMANGQPASADHTLLPFHSDWQVRTWGADTSWLDIGFDAAGWETMVGPVGEGDAPITRSVGGNGPRSDGPLRMRATIDVGDATRWADVRLLVRATAGVVVWVNGEEVFRDRVPEGAIGSGTVASGQGTDQGWLEIPLPGLMDGPNAVGAAVVPHDGWSDESWVDLAITARPSSPLVPWGGEWQASVDVNAEAWPGTEATAHGSWVAGPAPWGWSESGVASALPVSPTPQTAWMVHSFEVADPTAHEGLILEMLQPDGAVVYLNGTEVVRRGLPLAGLAAGASTPFTADEGWRLRSAPTWVDPTLLNEGTNVLAAQVYAAFPGRPLVFDAALYPVIDHD